MLLVELFNEVDGLAAAIHGLHEAVPSGKELSKLHLFSRRFWDSRLYFALDVEHLRYPNIGEFITWEVVDLDALRLVWEVCE